jgi:hypothetical protein
MISPHRVILEDPLPGNTKERKQKVGNKGRSAEVLLINSGKDQATYRISFKNMKMDENGGLQETPKAKGELTAEDLIRFSPREVKLEPGGSQIVRIQVRKPKDLAPGEYRSHMVFRAVPTAAPSVPTVERKEPASPEPPKEGLSVDIRVVYGVSIPIFVRHGPIRVEASLSDLRLEPPAKAGEAPVLHLRIQREGNRSVLGNLVANWRPKGGTASRIDVMKNFPVYSNLPYRNVAWAVDGLKGKSLGAGSLLVDYLDRETGKVIARGVLEMPGGGEP